jgi:hypothetical protein
MLCERYQEWMIPAALGGLSPERGRELRAHVEVCVQCRAEFERVKALTGAIDRGVAASVSVQPSPDLAARVRARIAESPAPASWPFARWMPLAAGTLAAAAVLALWLRPRATSAPPQKAPPVATTRSASPSEALPLRAERAASPRMSRPNRQQARESVAGLQVLVPPGEWNAVVRLAAAVNQGSVDGRQLVAAAEKSRAELGVNELQIAPLEIPLLSGEQNAAEESNPH